MSTQRDIVKEPDNVLRGKARDVDVSEIKSKNMQKLIEDMLATLKSTPDGVGLAAPQVGEPVRIFIVSEEAEEIDRTEKRDAKEGKKHKQDGHSRFEKGEEAAYEKREWKYYVYINPEVVRKSRTKISGLEGCLSVPGLFGDVTRHEKITVEAYDEHGKKFTAGKSRFFARVIQHEFDHLEGTLFIDKARDVRKMEGRKEW